MSFGFLKFRFQDDEVEIFFIFRVGEIFQRVLGHDNGTFVVVAHICAEIIVELGVHKLFEGQLVLKLEDGVLGYRDFVASREIVEKSLQLFDGFNCRGLIELWIGGIEIISVAGVEAGQLGVFPRG